MGAVFGADQIMDAFTVAFRLPNLARVLLGEGALTTAFLPVFVADIHENGRESAARTTWAVFITLSVFLCSLVLISEILLWAVGTIFELSSQAMLLKNLTAILLPYVILICLAAQLGAALNALGRFVWPALVPSILNLIWLITLWKIVPLWSDGIDRIRITAWSVVIGGVAQLLFVIPILQLCGFGYRSDWKLAMDRVRRIMSNMLPVVVGLSITQLNSVLDSLIAWTFTRPAGGAAVMPLPGSPLYPLSEGTATALYLGQRLYQFPLGVFGVALGTVLFPLLTSHAQRGEIDKLRTDLSLGIRLVVAIGIPASLGLMMIADPLANLFFRYGKFDAEAARQTGQMISAYSSGVWAYCGLLIVQRGFYAIGDRVTPMKVGFVAMLSNLLMNVTVIWFLGGRGLALSTAVIAAFQCAATLLLLQHRIGTLRWKDIGKTVWKTILASTVMCLACSFTFSWLKQTSLENSRVAILAIPLLMASVGYLLSSVVFGLKEPWELISGRPRLEATEDNKQLK